ncbi:DUF943 family protein [Rahnella bruchi]|uniref:DUF943 family protein n=1 Tax=Rahnella bruchi TaxID=1510573 RepID=UPI000EA39B3E|nr:DUF943 family protein [Rahnella bruchi]
MRKIVLIVTVLCFSISAYFLFFRKTEIIFVHHAEGVTDIVVKNFPITQIGKIPWWEAHEGAIKKKYGLPKSDENGVYYISVTDGGNGFKKVSQDNSN